MLNEAQVEANIPAGDIARARAFYQDKLGFTPTMEMEGVWLRYETASGTAFNVYATQYAGQAGHTIAQFHVTDVQDEVRALKAKGVAFETYPDMPGVDWDGDVASMGSMGYAAWFKDSEGNILCLDSGIPEQAASSGSTERPAS
ncbi:MAG TPA: VOC family protein [Dermatophilaceae bacterium]|nr:VOC family protein [Dermatophilaceae bacterium]